MIKNSAAQALRAIPSKKREEQSRINGRKGGRHPKNCTCPKHSALIEELKKES